MQLERNGRFQDFEQTRLVAHTHAALGFGGVAEGLDLFSSPVGLDVARRQDRDERGHATEPFDQRLVEVFVALQLVVPPDPGLLPQPLGQPDAKRALEVRHPPRLALDQCGVIDVGVTDERMRVEVHRFVRDNS